MMKLEVLEYPNSFLREPTEAVNITEESLIEVRKLARAMLDTMYADNGAGLAANQIGNKQKVLVIDARFVGTKRPLVLINPKLTWKSEETSIMVEGCLSFPGIGFSIERPEFVSFEAYDLTGRLQKYNGEKNPVLSRVFQHELDHLNNILMIDLIDDVELQKSTKENFDKEAV